MPITEHPYHIDEERSDIQFDVYGDQVAMMIPAGTGDTTIYDFYLIGDRDNTTPTNQNTFSALRILDEINSAIGYGNKYLRKDCEDETQYMLRLMGGAKVDGTLGLWIGDALLTYENGALHLSNCNGFWADGFISALGEGSGGGGGGGGGDFSREALFNILKSSPNTGEYINPSFIPIDGTTLYIQNGTLKSRGTISSVGLAVPTGFTVSNSPLTANGTITIGLASGYTIPTSEQMSSFLTQATAAATYLSKADAATTYLTKTEAASTYLTKTEAATTYLTIAFFDSLFQAYNGSSKITPNTSLPSSTENINIKAMFGFWTEKYISSLGQGSSGGGGAVSYLDDILDVTISQPSNGQVLTYQNGMWVNGSGSVDAYTKAQSNALFSTIENTVTALGTNGNYLTWTKNGTTNNITVPYATKALQDASGNEITVTYLTKAEAASTYLRIDFFDSLFQAYNGSSKITPNTSLPSSTTNVNIKAMFGFWTEQYIASLGQSSSGGLYLNTLDDVDTEGAQDGQALVYDYSTGTWVPGSVSGGGLDPTAMWNALATSGNQQIDASHLSDALGSYLPLTGGTLTGGLTTRTITPASNNTYNLGSSGTKWSTIYTNDIYSNDFTFNNGGWLTVEGGELGYRTSTASGNFKKVLLDGDSTTDTKVTQTATTTSSAYELLFSGTADNTTRTEGARKTSTLTYNPSTKALVTGGTINGYTLAAASAKAVVTSIDTSASLPTSNAVKTFVEGKGYATQTWVDNKGYAYSSDLDDYVLKAGDTMTGDLTIHDSILYFTGGAAGRKAWINKNGTFVFQTTTIGGWATGKLIVANDGSTSIGYSDGAFGSVNTLTYYFYGGNYDSPWVVLKPNSSNTFNMGIGTTSPSNKLHVNGGGRFENTIGVYGSNHSVRIVGNQLSTTDTTYYDFGLHLGSGHINRGFYQWSPSSKWLLYFDANNTIMNHGNVGIGTTSPSYKLHVSGTLYATGDVTALSDIRQKSPISDVNTRIEDVANLPLFYFRWKYKDDDNMHIGTSAQAVQKLFPELVLGGEELSVNYGVLGTTLGILNSRKLTEHERRILDLEKENKALRREINKLKGVAK